MRRLAKQFIYQFIYFGHDDGSRITTRVVLGNFLVNDVVAFAMTTSKFSKAKFHDGVELLFLLALNSIFI